MLPNARGPLLFPETPAGRVSPLPACSGADTIEHCSFAGPDRKEGSDFGPALVEEIAAAGIYVCPTMNVHAFTLRKRSGGALEKVIMGLYSGGGQIIAGPGASIGNCPHDACISGLEAPAMGSSPR
jgi:hypothetical protein